MKKPYNPQASNSKAPRMITQTQSYAHFDPAFENGLFCKAFEQQCRFEISRSGEEQITEQSFNIRVMTSPNLHSYSTIKVQISSESDLYMVLESEIDINKFERLKKSENFNFGFGNMLKFLIKQLHLCEKHSQEYKAVLYFKDKQATMIINEDIEHKSIQLISLKFQPIIPSALKRYIDYRFTMLKKMNEEIQSATQSFLSLVKLKNSNLYHTLTKKNEVKEVPNYSFSKFQKMKTSFSQHSIRGDRQDRKSF